MKCKRMMWSSELQVRYKLRIIWLNSANKAPQFLYSIKYGSRCGPVGLKFLTGVQLLVLLRKTVFMIDGMNSRCRHHFIINTLAKILIFA